MFATREELAFKPLSLSSCFKSLCGHFVKLVNVSPFPIELLLSAALLQFVWKHLGRFDFCGMGTMKRCLQSFLAKTSPRVKHLETVELCEELCARGKEEEAGGAGELDEPARPTS